MFAVRPVSVYEVDVGVPTLVYVPEALVLRYTLYPVAPVTDDQLTVMLVVEAPVALTPVGTVTESLVELTVTVQYAVLPPSWVVTVIIAIPALMPVTTPVVDTVTTAVLLLCHVTFLFVAS